MFLKPLNLPSFITFSAKIVKKRPRPKNITPKKFRIVGVIYSSLSASRCVPATKEYFVNRNV